VGSEVDACFVHLSFTSLFFIWICKCLGRWVVALVWSNGLSLLLLEMEV
jgi:hypothetical protein